MKKTAYVYTIAVDGLVRYVGKGTGGRVSRHVAKARTIIALRDDGEKVKTTIFYNRLCKALRAGAEIATEKIAVGLSDAGAFEREVATIASYPSGQLWNIREGGNGMSAKEAGEISRKNWDDPAMRAKITARIIETVRKPAFRKESSERTKRLHQDPSYKEKHLNRWNDADMRERHAKAVSASITDERRATFGASVSESWKDPVKVAARMAKRREKYAREFPSTRIGKVLFAVKERGSCRHSDLLDVVPDPKKLTNALNKLRKMGCVVNKGGKGGHDHGGGEWSVAE